MESDIPPPSMIKSYVKALFDFLLPRECVGCGKINPGGEFDYICEDCAAQIFEIKGARCLRCGELTGNPGSFDLPQCPKCADNPPHFNRSLSICAFSGTCRQILLCLKYRGGTHLLADISKILLKNTRAKPFLENAVLCPVPIHFTRRLRRRYNQAELIARTVENSFPGLNIKTANLLKRVRHKSTQTILDKAARERNIRGAFALGDDPAFADIRRDAKIVLVDDVMTTGATMSECARVLKKRGFANVDAFSFARRI